MAVRVCTQEPLKKLLDNETFVELSADTISAAFKTLQARYPRFAERMLEKDGSIRRFVNVYVNEEDIRFLQNQETQLRDGDEIRIIPSIAGG